MRKNRSLWGFLLSIEQRRERRLQEKRTEKIIPVALNLEDFTFWNTEGSCFNKETGELKIKGQWSGAQIWIEKEKGFNAESFGFVEILYENASSSFDAYVRYTTPSGTEKKKTRKYAESTNNRIYIPLDEEYKKEVRMIYFVNRSKDPLTVKIKSIKFTNEKKTLLPVTDTGRKKKFNDSLSSIDFVKNLKAGWNLGNTLDSYAAWETPNSALGVDSEICWNEPYTTKKIIHLGKKNGYTSIRIPVTWYNHIIDEKYTIDPLWMARVKQLVDWAIEDGYYVILNEHHSVRDQMNNPIKYGDGYTVNSNQEEIAESKRFLKAIWKQITKAFNQSYDEHLIFETINEPRNSQHEHTWQPGLKLDWCDNSECAECNADYGILNEYNQLCLDVIRKSGSNNRKRYVIIPSLNAGIDQAVHPKFSFPSDSAKDKLILTVHDYSLGLAQDPSAFTETMHEDMKKRYRLLNETYVKKGIPVVIGETGAKHKTPLLERLVWISKFARIAHGYGMALFYWECGKVDSDEEMCLFNRNRLTVNEGCQTIVKSFADEMNA